MPPNAVTGISPAKKRRTKTVATIPVLGPRKRGVEIAASVIVAPYACSPTSNAAIILMFEVKYRYHNKSLIYIMISVMQDCQVRQLCMGRNEGRGVGSASFLLAQLGNHAATKFAERLEPLGFAPHHAGIFRILAQNPGLSQQDLAKTLCI